MKSDINALLEKANEKLITAKIDLDNNRFDDSISRSYYAVFHGISACLFYKGLTFSSHNQTIGAFNKEFVKTGIFEKNTTSIIQSLFEDRQSGDYDVYFKSDKTLALKHYNNATTLVIKIKSYLNL